MLELGRDGLREIAVPCVPWSKTARPMSAVLGWDAYGLTAVTLFLKMFIVILAQGSVRISQSGQPLPWISWTKHACSRRFAA
jgi:hypothetical protein